MVLVVQLFNVLREHRERAMIEGKTIKKTRQPRPTAPAPPAPAKTTLKTSEEDKKDMLDEFL
jgi:hypothetical protein